MNVFVDTSAFFAILDIDDVNHKKAKTHWIDLIQNKSNLVSTNYILLESFALIQRRLGMKALKAFQENILPIVHIEWINETLHLSGVMSLLQASQKKLSLVDCISFIVMRYLNIETVLTHDRHFKREGFYCIGI